MLRDIKTLKAIASRTMCNRFTSKKQPASVSAQFQVGKLPVIYMNISCVLEFYAKFYACWILSS